MARCRYSERIKKKTHKSILVNQKIKSDKDPWGLKELTYEKG